MNNIKINDLSVEIQYIQSFFKQIFSRDLIMSNYYDYNTHQSIINSLNNYTITELSTVLNDVTTNTKLIDSDNKQVLDYYFITKEDLNTITFKFKYKNEDTLKQVRDFFFSNNSEKRLELISILNPYKWRVAYFDLSSVEDAQILLVPIYRDIGIIKEDIMPMINLYNEHRYLYNYAFNGMSFIPDNSKKIMIIDYNYSNVYSIISNNTMSGSIRVALSNKTYKDIISSDLSLQEIYHSGIEFEDLLGNNLEIISNDSSMKTMLIEVPYNYIDKMLILTSSLSNLKDLCIDVDDKDFMNKFYFNEQWLIHKKFLQYILRHTINKYSDEESIRYVQELWSKLDNNYNSEKYVWGIYDDTLKENIRKYQQDKHIVYANGTIDTDTESLLLYEQGVKNNG